jgi:outer membrane protein assembly factor BamB
MILNSLLALVLFASSPAPALLTFTIPILAQELPSWPWFRGVARDGVSHETGWDAVGRDEPLWSANVGMGYSAPSIAAGRLFTQGFDEEAELDHLICLDAETGEEHWRYEWPAQQRANFHRGGALTTPAVDGDLVYATNRFGLFLCFQADTGELIWDRNFAEELELDVTFHGFSSSVIVLEDRFVLTFGGTTFAVDKETQEVLWKTDDYGDGGYSNPVPFDLRGTASLAVLHGDGLYMFDLDTGAELATHPWVPPGMGVNVCPPVVVGDRIFLSTGYEKGCTLVSFADEGGPKILWENKVLRNHVSGCTLFEGYLYGFDESVLKCIDLEGKEQWRERGLGKGSVAVAGGRLIVLSSRGELIVAEADPEAFRELSRKKVLDDGEYWTTPVLLGGRIYCRNSLGDLVCLDHRPARTGEK